MKNKLERFLPFLELIFEIIKSILAFILILSLCLYTKAYGFFIPILIVPILNFIIKSLKIIYLINITKNPELSLKAIQISNYFNLRGLGFYLFGFIIIGTIITFNFKRDPKSLIIASILATILLAIGLFLDIKRKK